MKVRIVDREGNFLVDGELIESRLDRDQRWAASPREGVAAVGRGEPFVAPPSNGHAVVKLAESTALPLWYGGTSMHTSLDFSLPSGLFNIWGQGNDFDTDAFKIHPDDLEAVISAARKK